MKASVIFLALCAAGILIRSPTAMAVQSNPACVSDAQNDYELCKAECKENFLVEKDLCRNVSHDCADGCRSQHSSCVEPSLETLDTCKDSCDQALQTQKALCRDQTAKGSHQRDACIDAAQVAGFVCRDTCREGVAGQLQQCTKTLQACVSSCPPAH